MGPPSAGRGGGAAQARVLAVALAVFAFIYGTTLMQVGAAIRLRSCPPARPPTRRRSPAAAHPPPLTLHHSSITQALPAAHTHFHALTLTASAGLGLWGYLLTALTDPGRVPPGWAPDAEAALEAVKRRDGRARRCAKCAGAGKPPRAHHCRRCGRCVLMMDHRASHWGRGVQVWRARPDSFMIRGAIRGAPAAAPPIYLLSHRELTHSHLHPARRQTAPSPAAASGTATSAPF
jgi:hypothetical protein